MIYVFHFTLFLKNCLLFLNYFWLPHFFGNVDLGSHNETQMYLGMHTLQLPQNNNNKYVLFSSIHWIIASYLQIQR